ncbi:MAG: DUF2513 domain-containing protein [Acetivibrio ethanolgignens]
MKLNPDCVRDILLTVEENTGFNKEMDFSEHSSYELLNQYSSDEVFYHIKQCEASYLIEEVRWFLGGSCSISDLTPRGHEFLTNIRNDSIWKKALTKGTGASLSILMEIAKQVATNHFLG